MAYNPNVIFPETWAQGSSFGIGYDTNILQLENGKEFTIPRMPAWGRRKYNVIRNNISRSDLITLIRFYQLRGGSRDSFKFKDWNEYATTSTGYVDNTYTITPFDMTLQLVSGNTYQCVYTISDAGGSMSRPIEKIKASTFRCGANGTEIFSPNYTLNAETGQVTFSTSLGAIATATAGFEYYVVVKFAPETDQLLEALMQAVQSNGSLPAIHLQEEMSLAPITQYGFWGGAYGGSVPNGTTVSLTMLNGLFQAWTFGNTSSHLQLPDVIDMPLGGPLFIIYGESATTSNKVKTSDGTNLAAMNTGKTVEFYVYVDSTGVKKWAACGRDGA